VDLKRRASATVGTVIVAVWVAGGAAAQGRTQQEGPATVSASDPGDGAGDDASDDAETAEADADDDAETAGADADEEAASEGDGVAHVPVHELVGEDAVLLFDVVDPLFIGEVVVRYRRLEGEGGVVEVEAQPTEDPEQLAARIPVEDVGESGLVYWVVERTPDGSERPLFASPAAPHPVHVHPPEDIAYARRRLAAWGGRRNRIRLRGEYVNLGEREVVDASGTARQETEAYYRVGVMYSYSFFSIVDTILIGLGRMRGNVVDPEMAEDERGVDYGHGHITWHLHDLFRLETGILFGFSQEGFEIGGHTDLLIGEPEGNSVTLGVDGITGLGATGKVRLGWATVPRFPMGATLEVTTFPVGDKTGMRLLYDVAFEIYPGAFARVEAGYRGWGSTTGGLSLGAELVLSL
jgi:hypothetical protein